ncbi:hypothetical protein QQP08_021591 [Theobroma cacao]|uniref:Uncharacterized protein n=1 Tax=Theobroma cacao TaxID=3641 RepID=A0A061F944_THECC|nr:Uncharacterized protein TCM_031991 [Theobroma cacao]WRX29104.1 hypothetical protein QQP08_021591 [Theobroma cacao]
MTRLSFVFLIFLLALVNPSPSSEARKHLNMEKKVIPSMKENVVPSVLPQKATPAPSASGNKGHLMVNDERLFAHHLAKIDRILQSNPSPGSGHY